MLSAKEAHHLVDSYIGKRGKEFQPLSHTNINDLEYMIINRALSGYYNVNLSRKYDRVLVKAILTNNKEIRDVLEDLGYTVDIKIKNINILY